MIFVFFLVAPRELRRFIRILQMISSGEIVSTLHDIQRGKLKKGGSLLGEGRIM